MLTFDFSLALNHFTLAVKHSISDCGITGLLGPSGSGKTSILRVLSGLSHEAKGYISLNEKTLLNSQNGTFLPAFQRNIGFVFQDARLFPHLNVLENIQYSISNTNQKTKSSIKLPLDELIDLAGLKHLLNAHVNHLSAGEKQRVAIVRAVVAQPELLLLDEPLAHLDNTSRHQMLALIKQINQKLSLPMIYISHDHFEIQQLAQQVLVLEKGQIIQHGNVHQVLNNLSPVALHDAPNQTSLELYVIENILEQGLTKLHFDLTNTDKSQAIYIGSTDFKRGEKVRLFIKAQDISLCLSKPLDSSIVNALKAKVTTIEFGQNSAFVKAQLDTDEQEFNISISKFSANRLNIQSGCTVYLQFKASALRYI